MPPGIQQRPQHTGDFRWRDAHCHLQCLGYRTALGGNPGGL